MSDRYKLLLAVLVAFIFLTGASSLVNLSNQVQGVLHVANGGTGTASTLSGVLKGGNPIGSAVATDIVALFSGCSGTQYLGADGACHAAGGSGTVTSVALSLPSAFTVTGSPVTTSGTLTGAYNVAGADYLITAIAANTAAWEQINGGSSCGDSTHAVSYSTVSHTFGCQNITGSGGTGFPTVLYNTPSSSSNSAISATTMVTPGSDGTFRFSYYYTQVDVGTGCTGNTTLNEGQVIYTDPYSGGSQPFTVNVPIIVSASTAFGTSRLLTNGTISTSQIGSAIWTFRAKASTTIQFASGTYTIGSGCSVGPHYRMVPILEQLG